MVMGAQPLGLFLNLMDFTDGQFEEQLKGFDVEVQNWNKRLSSSNS
jgi:hypothetical protein